MTINGSDIRMIRGDTEQLVVTCQLSDGTERPFEEGDTVTLTVAWAMGPEVLQKTVTSFQEGAAFVLLNHEDTNDLTPANMPMMCSSQQRMGWWPPSSRPPGSYWKGM